MDDRSLLESKIELIDGLITRFSNLANFSTGVLARDEKGRSVPFDSRYAVSFCLLGGVLRAGYEGNKAVGYRSSADADDSIQYKIAGDVLTSCYPGGIEALRDLANADTPCPSDVIWFLFNDSNGLILISALLRKMQNHLAIQKLLMDIEALEQIISVIEDPEKRTKRHLAVDACLESVDPYSDGAVRFCVLGATLLAVDPTGRSHSADWYTIAADFLTSYFPDGLTGLRQFTGYSYYSPSHIWYTVNDHENWNLLSEMLHTALDHAAVQLYRMDRDV